MILQGCLIVLLAIALKMLLKHLGDRDAFDIQADVWDVAEIFVWNITLSIGIVFICGGALRAAIT